MFLPAGGGWEPFLTASVTYDEADTEAHAMELTSLYPPPCISLTEILLGAELVTAAVLLIGFLVIKLRTEKKEKAILFERIMDADDGYELRYGRDVSELKQMHCNEIEALQVEDTLMQIQCDNLAGWVRIFQKWIREILNGTQIKDKEALQNIVNNEDLKMISPPLLYLSWRGIMLTTPRPKVYGDPTTTTPIMEFPLFKNIEYDTEEEI